MSTKRSRKRKALTCNLQILIEGFWITSASFKQNFKRLANVCSQKALFDAYQIQQSSNNCKKLFEPVLNSFCCLRMLHTVSSVSHISLLLPRNVSLFSLLEARGASPPTFLHCKRNFYKIESVSTPQEFAALLLVLGSVRSSVRVQSQSARFLAVNNLIKKYCIIALGITKRCPLLSTIFLYLPMPKAFPIFCILAKMTSFLKAVWVTRYPILWVRLKKSAYMKRIWL